MNYLTRNKEKETCMNLVLCIRSNRLYIVKYRGFRPMSDLWNIIFNTIKVKVMDVVPFKLLQCYSAKQPFLDVDFCALFIATFIRRF